MCKNYPHSTRKGTKHMHARCFFVADELESKDLRMMHCPTEKMLADISSKPTQGALFLKQRNLIMGLREEDFELYEAWYECVLEKYELWDDEESDLSEL